MAIIETLRIPVPIRVAAGHQPHITGTGAHKDKRTKRNRTRSDQRRNAIRDQGV